jgi:peptide alpha-N-acetyltransferase
MMELDAPHPKVHERIVEFQYVIGHSLSSLSTKVAQLIKADFKAIPANTDLKKYNDEFRDKNKSSAKHALSSIRCQKVLGEDRGKCEKDLTGLLQMKEASLEVAFEALETLKSWRSGEVEAFKKAAREKWPEVTRFA